MHRRQSGGLPEAVQEFLWDPKAESVTGGEVGPGAGDVAGGADFRPTDTSIALLAELEKELAVSKGEYEALLAQDVSAFNRLMGEKNSPAVK